MLRADMLKPGEKLKAHRDGRGLSQGELGALINASQAQVSRIEHGGCPTLEQALAIEQLKAGLDVEVWPWAGPMAAYIRKQKRKVG